MDKALEWWAKQPIWVCAATFGVGWLFLGGLGPLVMIPVLGACVFPPVNRIVENPGRLLTPLKNAWNEFKRGLAGAPYRDEPGCDSPEPTLSTPSPCDGVHHHHHVVEVDPSTPAGPAPVLTGPATASGTSIRRPAASAGSIPRDAVVVQAVGHTARHAAQDRGL